MTLPQGTLLPHRGIIRVSGKDCRNFLQGLISNDVTKVTTQTGIYATLLTPQGKFLHDLFIIEQEGALLIDCESYRSEDLVRRLTAYKLRADVTVLNLSTDYSVWAIWGGIYSAPLTFVDPRLSLLGMRSIVATDETPAGLQITTMATHDTLRMTAGVADGSRDLEIEKSTLADGNIDLLNGVDWKKGCYVGQELTARMHYRRLAKKRLFPVWINGSAHSSSVLTFKNTDVGSLRGQGSGIGLALVNVDAVQASIGENVPLMCGDIAMVPFIPTWMQTDLNIPATSP